MTTDYKDCLVTITIASLNTIISPNLLVWKICGKRQFSQCFGRINRSWPMILRRSNTNFDFGKSLENKFIFTNQFPLSSGLINQNSKLLSSLERLKLAPYPCYSTTIKKTGRKWLKIYKINANSAILNMCYLLTFWKNANYFWLVKTNFYKICWE